MRLLTVLALLLLPGLTSAESPHPLRFVPAQANLVIRIEQPRKVIETITHLDLVQQMKTLPFVREQLQAPTYQRFLQLVQYYEKELGLPRPELLDKLAGRGFTLASTAEGDKAPVLFVIEGTDEPLAERFVQLAISVFEQELAREESKDKLEQREYRGITAYRIGDLRFARLGTTLLLSNNDDALKRALDLSHGEGKSIITTPGPDAARKSLPADCLAWMYLNLDIARKAPDAQTTFALPTNDPVQLFLIGGWLNVVKRAPFLAAGLTREGDTFRLTFKLPGGGRTGLPKALSLHVPPKDLKVAPPLLEPKGVMFSHRFWFDVHALYEQREGLLNEMLAKSFEDGEKEIRKFLLGRSLAELSGQAGAWHRVVVAHPDKASDRVKPQGYFPAIAYVNSMRDPAFAKPMSGILRAVALFAGQAYKPQSFEETHNEVTISGYRFPENIAVADDPEGVRYHFTPCFAAVGDQFVMCSTLDFCREIIDLLKKEAATAKPAVNTSPFNARFYGSGAVELLRGFEVEVLGQIILDQAVAPTEARDQMNQLLAWIKRLGTLELRSNYLDNEFRFEVEWKISH